MHYKETRWKEASTVKWQFFFLQEMCCCGKWSRMGYPVDLLWFLIKDIEIRSTFFCRTVLCISYVNATNVVMWSCEKRRESVSKTKNSTELAIWTIGLASEHDRDVQMRKFVGKMLTFRSETQLNRTQLICRAPPPLSGWLFECANICTLSNHLYCNRCRLHGIWCWYMRIKRRNQSCIKWNERDLTSHFNLIGGFYFYSVRRFIWFDMILSLDCALVISIK